MNKRSHARSFTYPPLPPLLIWRHHLGRCGTVGLQTSCVFPVFEHPPLLSGASEDGFLHSSQRFPGVAPPRGRIAPTAQHLPGRLRAGCGQLGVPAGPPPGQRALRLRTRSRPCAQRGPEDEDRASGFSVKGVLHLGGERESLGTGVTGTPNRTYLGSHPGSPTRGRRRAGWGGCCAPLRAGPRDPGRLAGGGRASQLVPCLDLVTSP